MEDICSELNLNDRGKMRVVVRRVDAKHRTCLEILEHLRRSGDWEAAGGINAATGINFDKVKECLDDLYRERLVKTRRGNSGRQHYTYFKAV